MKKFLKFLCLLTVIFIASGGLGSCSGDEPSQPEKPSDSGDGRLILVYAVAANNLQSYLYLDKQEMMNAGPRLDLDNNKLLVYSVVNNGDCILQELRKNDGKYEFATIAEFDSLPLSTSPERITEVINYVNDKFQYDKKGLVLWSHADGWLPWFAGSTPNGVKQKSFGWDNFDGGTYKTNINALAEAIPAGIFDFIWFDCCYMANIETIYELRDKTDYIVGSVLETPAEGMPYDLTMPYLLRSDAELEKAAEAFYQEYMGRNPSTPVSSLYYGVSISIIDTSYLYLLADAAKEIFNTGIAPTSLSGIQTYQRSLSEKFYDMGQLLRSYYGVSEESWQTLAEAFGEVVVFKRISPYDYNVKPVNVEAYSGLSMHHYLDSGSSNEMFYQSLDWFKATR